MAWLKGLLALAAILRDLLDWIRDLRRKQALDAADEKHAENDAAIDRAFRAPAGPVVLPNSADAAQPRSATPGAPSIPGSKGGGS